MAVPTYDDFFRPFLDALADMEVHSIGNIRGWIAEYGHLSLEDLSEPQPAGNQTLFANRVNWAGTYLFKAGLVERPRRGKYRLTQEGLRVQRDREILLDLNYLMRYPSFVHFVKGSSL